MSGRVVQIEGTDPLDEGLHAALLEDAHQWRLESLASIRGDLSDGGSRTGTLLNVAASDLLELEVAGNIGRDENVGELARGHEELGDQVNVPVIHASVLLPGLLAGVKVAVLLEELLWRTGLVLVLAKSTEQWRLTVSRLIEAASLDIGIERLADATGHGLRVNAVVVDERSVVVILVNVEDLLSLDTENTAVVK